MAVIIDVQAFRDSLPADTYDAAAELRHTGGVGELAPAGGGVQAAVRDGGASYLSWVGVVARNLTAECECSTMDDGHGSTTTEDWCAHAVAVTLTALEQGVRWSGAATPPSATQPAAGPGTARQRRVPHRRASGSRGRAS